MGLTIQWHRKHIINVKSTGITIFGGTAVHIVIGIVDNIIINVIHYKVFAFNRVVFFWFVMQNIVQQMITPIICGQ